MVDFFQDVSEKCKSLGINALHVKIRATGGNKTKTPGPGGQSALRALARSGMKIGRIEVSSGVHSFEDSRYLVMSTLLSNIKNLMFH